MQVENTKMLGDLVKLLLGLGGFIGLISTTRTTPENSFLGPHSIPQPRVLASASRGVRTVLGFVGKCWEGLVQHLGHTRLEDSAAGGAPRFRTPRR